MPSLLMMKDIIMSRFISSCRISGFALLALLVVIGGAMMRPQMAFADFIDGNQLRLYCTSQNPSDDAICIVYITGAFDAFTTVDLIAEKTSGAVRQFCPDENTGPDQLKALTLKWLERPETNADFAATLIIWGAMKDAFGCDAS